MNKNVDNTKEFRLLSICTGYGGIEHGLSLAGFKHRVQAFLEVEAFCCSNLVKAMEVGAIRPAPIWTDLKTFDAEPFRGLVDIVVGGYPCQPFSAAGTRSGVEDPRHLWPYIFQIVCTTRPIYVFFENVEGHITLGLDAVVKDLQGAGYIVEVGLFSSEETGASHSRKRIFILGKLANSHSGNVGNRSRQIQSQTKEVEGEQQRKDGERMRSEFESRSTELANSGLQRQKIKKKQATRSEQFSGELANTNSIRKREMEQKPESDVFNGNSYENLANTSGEGLQRTKQQRKKYAWKEFYGTITKRCSIARPGQQQYDWEEPRANTKKSLKSRLGLPTDGYDYRTDLLRALGNGVDPWTAKLAFETLMDKLK